MAESKANLHHDDFVSKVVKDPKQPPDTILLTGYLGKSSEEGHTRLHFDPELKSYIEIPNDAILHTQPIPPEHSSLGGSHVWIKSDAELIHGKVGPSRTKAKFFEGPIGAAAAAAGAGGVAPLGPTQINCPTHAPLLCPITVQAPCPTLVGGCVPTPPHPACPPPPTPLCTHVQCATPLHGCPVTQVTQCPTPLHGCPTSFGCPTPFHGCPPPTPLHGCFTPACPTLPIHGCPPPTLSHVCPTPVGGCPPHTINVVACIPHLTQAAPQCVASPAPACGGGFPGGPGGPVEQGVFAPQAALLPTSPAVCQVFTPACPSLHNICPTNPVICHASPFCPSLHNICPTNPAICHPSPFCPSPFCPSLRIPCVTTPGCPFPTAGCPFNPGGGGGI